MKLHVTPHFGGELLSFKPLRLSIDDEWKAINFEEGDYDIYDNDTQNENTQSYANDTEEFFATMGNNNDTNHSNQSFNNNRKKHKRDRKLYQREKPSVLNKKRLSTRKIQDAEYTMKKEN